VTGCFEHGNERSASLKCWRFFLIVDERLLASKEGQSSMKNYCDCTIQYNFTSPTHTLRILTASLMRQLC
jgi:hypothetical protein